MKYNNKFEYTFFTLLQFYLRYQRWNITIYITFDILFLDIGMSRLNVCETIAFL